MRRLSRHGRVTRHPCPCAGSCSAYPRFFGDKNPILVYKDPTDQQTDILDCVYLGYTPCPYLETKPVQDGLLRAIKMDGGP